VCTNPAEELACGALVATNEGSGATAVWTDDEVDGVADMDPGGTGSGLPLLAAGEGAVPGCESAVGDTGEKT